MQFQSNVHHGGEAPISSMYLPGMSDRIAIDYSANIKPSKQALWGEAANLKKSVTNDDLKKGSTAIEEKSVVPAVEKDESSSSCETTAEPPPAEPQEIFYQAGVFGPRKSFFAPEKTARTDAATTTLQRAARGMVARTNFRIRVLEHKLATIQACTAADLAQVQEETKERKLKLRRKATKKEAKSFRKQLACAETANNGNQLIHYLRSENKKLRKKNDKIAASIQELKTQNDRLEDATVLTGDNQSLLGSHYNQIKQTNDALKIIVPRYQAKLEEMKEASEIRRQYCLSEHKMKVMYVKLVGTLAEMVEHHSGQPELTEEVVAFCIDMEDYHDGSSSSSARMLEDCKEVEQANDDDDDYDEVSVGSDDDTDSNNYDEYAVASLHNPE